jgi:7-dehydrocholesterol reductase
MTKSTDEDRVTWGDGGLFGNRIVGSLVLILFTPVFITIFLGTAYYYDGDFYKLFDEINQIGLYQVIKLGFPSPLDPYPWKMIGYFVAFQLFLMKFLPGKEFKATTTATGFVPTYKANGVQSYFVTIITLFALAYFKIWKPADAYNNLGKLLVDSNILALTLCVFLTFKGLYAPSTKVING